MRLDKLVQKKLVGFGRRSVTELFARRAVRVAGAAARKGAIAREGDSIEVALDEHAWIAPETDAHLEVVLETENVVVVDKPAGQPTVPVSLGEGGTLASALLARYPEMAAIGHRPREPGLLHRLDTQTSGLLVAARTARAFETLSTALSEGRIRKRYLAVVREAGLPASGVIDAPLAPARRDSRRVEVVIGRGRAAVTRFSVVSRARGFALVECEVGHAYRHQIRVHLASLGHPIAGDRAYGGPDVPELGERHALHASHVAWAGDEDVPPFEADAPLPRDLAALLGG